MRIEALETRQPQTVVFDVGNNFFFALRAGKMLFKVIKVAAQHIVGVFINVMMLNLCYDIPVKLYSMNLVLLCLYLVANEYRRMACFFVLNKPAACCSVYDQPLTKKWMRISRIVIKLGIVFLLCKSFYEDLQFSREYSVIKSYKDFKPGVYDVKLYVVNRDTLPPLLTDSIRWKDLIIENNGIMGSINTADMQLRRRYGRGYFNWTVDIR